MKQKLIKNIGALVILIFALGCATGGGKQGAVQGAQNPVLTALDITDNKLNIVVDKPFTYTIYKSSDPYKVIVELPDVRMGFAPNKIKSDKAGITEIIPSQTEDPVSTKLEILLSSPVTVEPVYKDTTLALKVKEEPEAKGAEITSEAPKAEEKVQEVSAPAVKVEEPVKWAEVAQPEQTAVPAAESKGEPAAAGAEQKTIMAAAAKENDTTAKPEQKTSIARELPPATSILQVKIEKGQDVLKVVIKGNGSLNPNVFRLDNRAVLDMPSVDMAAVLPAAVPLPLTSIRAGRHKDKTRLVLDMKEGTSFDVAAIEDSVIISFRLPEERYAAKAAVGETKVAEVEAKAVVETQEKPGESRYKGQKISLDFQDADIGPIFRLLADISGYNFIIDQAVKGRITMKLTNVPWDQALDIILQTFNLTQSKEGNIIWIAQSDMFAKIRNAKAAEKDQMEKQEDLEQEIVRINYAEAGTISGAISSGKLLSTRGSITIDGRMNTLIIKDTQKSIDKIKALVKIMDVAKSQVMIEAKIVTASTSYTSSLGIRWGGTFEGAPGRTFTGGPTTGAIAYGGDQTGAGGIRNLGNEVIGAVSVNTPVSPASGAGGILSMLIGSANSTQIALSLSALETIKKAKTLSNPRILTMDNEAATITQGVTFYTTSTSAEGTKTEPQNAALSLSVTPKITPDGYIYLKLTVSDDSLASVSPPVKNTKTINTQALVKDGETLVLGGIYTDTEVNDTTGIPLLSKIPILGWLFKTKQDTGPGPTEMLIFITPRVVSKPI